jgi:hypothetical protein
MLASFPSLPGLTAGERNGEQHTESEEESEVDVPSDKQEDARFHDEHEELEACYDGDELPVRERHGSACLSGRSVVARPLSD